MSFSDLGLLFAWLGKATQDQIRRFIAKLTLADHFQLDAWFELWAHRSQLPPKRAGWRTWLMQAGRGFGKTRAGADSSFSIQLRCSLSQSHRGPKIGGSRSANQRRGHQQRRPCDGAEKSPRGAPIRSPRPQVGPRSTAKRGGQLRRFLRRFDSTDLSGRKKLKYVKGFCIRPICIAAFAQQSHRNPPLARQPALS